MSVAEIDPQAAFEETLAALKLERAPKLTLSRKKAQPRFEQGIINLSDFKKNYNRVCAHAAYDARIIVVTLGSKMEKVFIVAPEDQLEIPSDARFVQSSDAMSAGKFISLSMPEPFAEHYRQAMLQLKPKSGQSKMDDALRTFGGEPLGPNVFWRRDYPEAGAVIIAQYGTAKPKSSVPQPH